MTYEPSLEAFDSLLKEAADAWNSTACASLCFEQPTPARIEEPWGPACRIHVMLESDRPQEPYPTPEPAEDEERTDVVAAVRYRISTRNVLGARVTLGDHLLEPEESVESVKRALLGGLGRAAGLRREANDVPSIMGPPADENVFEITESDRRQQLRRYGRRENCS